MKRNQGGYSLDEVTYIVNLLENNWDTNAAALLTAGDRL